MNVDSKPKEVTPPPTSSSGGGDSGSNVPSGFILKLFQMVNGAPDEVISVSYMLFCRTIWRLGSVCAGRGP